MSLAVGPATAADPADDLLYLSAKPYYDAYAGSEARARALLASVYRRPGHAASFEVCPRSSSAKWQADQCSSATFRSAGRSTLQISFA